jgi:hypothetical protein
MSRCPTHIIQLTIMSKLAGQHIITKISFKITIRKRYVYIDIGWPWIWNRGFYLGIWNDDPTTRFNSQNANETEILTKPYTLIFYEYSYFQLA